MNENLPPLFFYNFFQRVKHELGYSRSVGKYMEFCIVIATGAVRFGAGPEQPEMLQFLKVFLLENERHRADFERIFLEELDAEVLRMRSAFDKKFTPEAVVFDEKKGADFSKKPDPPPAGLGENPPPAPAGIVDNLEEKAPKATETIEEKEKTEDFWFMLGHDDPNEKPQPAPEKPPTTAHFNLSDEYFPLTRRELMKTWQYLRLRCPAGVSGQLDIGATVKQVARDGFFMNPVFEKNWATRPDALLILADRDDAMTPFHELINRITSTALDATAHPQAGVGYFHKYPIIGSTKNRRSPMPARSARRSARTTSRTRSRSSSATVARRVANRKMPSASPECPIF